MIKDKTTTVDSNSSTKTMSLYKKSKRFALWTMIIILAFFALNYSSVRERSILHKAMQSTFSTVTKDKNGLVLDTPISTLAIKDSSESLHKNVEENVVIKESVAQNSAEILHLTNKQEIDENGENIINAIENNLYIVQNTHAMAIFNHAKNRIVNKMKTGGSISDELNLITKVAEFYKINISKNITFHSIKAPLTLVKECFYNSEDKKSSVASVDIPSNDDSNRSTICQKERSIKMWASRYFGIRKIIKQQHMEQVIDSIAYKISINDYHGAINVINSTVNNICNVEIIAQELHNFIDLTEFLDSVEREIYQKQIDILSCYDE